ncbi:FecR family protein [Pinirhizobacter sp.]|jgi:ferric-dicitrate binding protein FerR (iron transport regulator)|uniref:FecR family protein n=1 Tax=Pinirhizobacter sp. TaxID=2950432 RepID=UPI002F413DC5
MDGHPFHRTTDDELRREAQAWLLRLTSGHATVADAQAFRQWCARSPAHAQAFARTRMLWEDLARHAPNIRESSQLSRKQPSRDRGGPRMSRRAFIGGAVAATAAVLLARAPITAWLEADGADLRTAKGEQRRVEVARGVVVEMNTQTAIRLVPGGRGMTLLEGEATITTGQWLAQPFAVQAGNGRVLAAASSECNVRCMDRGVQVTCLEGSTELACGGLEATVKPSQQLGYDDQGPGVAVAVNPDVAMAWRRQLLIYDDEPLSAVIDDINRYRPGKIILTNRELAARKVHARFSLDQMADIATLIHDAYGADITTLPGGVILLG